MSAFGLRGIIFGVDSRLEIEFDSEGSSFDLLKGAVVVSSKRGQSIKHEGLKVEWIGQIELSDSASGCDEFTHSSQGLRVPGEISSGTRVRFEFANLEKKYDSYYGANVKLRYIVRATLYQISGKAVAQSDVDVVFYVPRPEVSPDVWLELGIDNSLLLDFKILSSSFALDDVLVGYLRFKLVRTEILSIRLYILRVEKNLQTNNSYKADILSSLQVVNGCPSSGDFLPIRLYLRKDLLTPSYSNVNNKFSVTHYASLQLMDKNNRKYSWKSNIVLYRSKESQDCPKKIQIQ